MKYLAIALVGLAAVFLAGCVQGPQDLAAQHAAEVTPGAGAQVSENITALGTVADAKWNRYPELKRRLNAYMNSTKGTKISVKRDYLPSEVFSKLPPIPDDFYVIKLFFELGRVTNLSRIGPAYWMQPEFQPTFEDTCVTTMQNPPSDRWGAFGYSSYPSEIIVFSPRRDSWVTEFIVSTGCLVETYQGFGLTPEFPASGALQHSAFPDNTRSVTQDPAVVSKYFDVEVTPKDVLLEPAYPVFEAGYVHKVTVTVTSKNAPPGKYVIAINAGSPSKESDDTWFWKYKNAYVGGGGMFNTGVPLYSMFIEVT